MQPSSPTIRWLVVGSLFTSVWWGDPPPVRAQQVTVATYETTAPSVPWETRDSRFPERLPTTDPGLAIGRASWTDMEGTPRLDHAHVATDDLTRAGEPVSSSFEWEAVGRAFYTNDQRIEFSGQEATFGAEGAMRGAYTHWVGDWQTRIVGEFFLNEPFNRNLLADTPERRSYLANFQVDPFSFQQLYVSARNGDWYFAAGKMPTPFGRYYFPLYRNDYSDAPFIRTESIAWQETGVLAQWNPAPWIATVALTNGGDGRDTNSSKAFIARLGAESDWYSLGASVKASDGIGSEGQKEYKSHAGIDAMIRQGPFRLSTEVIYDLYGMRHPFDPNQITWGRSLYYRDATLVPGQPLHGIGYYVNLDYQSERWTVMLNYGEYFPEQIGDPRQDVTTRRGIAKVGYHFDPQLELFGMYLSENDVTNAQDGRIRRGQDILIGVQYGL